MMDILLWIYPNMMLHYMYKYSFQILVGQYIYIFDFVK
jgi:hypothetical protein